MNWEYKTIKFRAEGFLGGEFDESRLLAEMNELGSMGWEMVSAVSSNSARGASRYLVAIFKRPLDK